MSRVQEEYDHVEELYSRLIAFISSSPHYLGLDKLHQRLMQEQRQAMKEYLRILSTRIELLKDNVPDG